MTVTMASVEAHGTPATKSVSKLDPDDTIIGAVTRKRKDKKLGILFGQSKGGGCVYIRKIEGRLAKKTDLVAGLEVLEVNGVAIGSAKQAATLLRSTKVGEQAIVVARGQCVKAKKQRTDRAGVMLTPLGKNKVEVTMVSEEGLFPTIRPGQILLAINGQSVDSVSKANEIVTKSRSLTLVVADPTPYTLAKGRTGSDLSATASTITDKSDRSEADGEIVVVEVIKPDVSSKVGLSLKKCGMSNAIVIGAIAEQGLFSSSSLKVGQKILRINSSPCPASTPVAIDMIKKTEGTLRIEACDVRMKSVSLIGDVILAEATKPDVSSKVGISFKNSYNSVLIGAIAEKGLFSTSSLQVGQKVLKINGAPCPASASDASNLIKRSEGTVSIEASSFTLSSPVKQSQTSNSDEAEVPVEVREMAASDEVTKMVEEVPEETLAASIVAEPTTETSKEDQVETKQAISKAIESPTLPDEEQDEVVAEEKNVVETQADDEEQVSTEEQPQFEEKSQLPVEENNVIEIEGKPTKPEAEVKQEVVLVETVDETATVEDEPTEEDIQVSSTPEPVDKSVEAELPSPKLEDEDEDEDEVEDDYELEVEIKERGSVEVEEPKLPRTSSLLARGSSMFARVSMIVDGISETFKDLEEY